jgi:hypothetical protein
LSQSARCHREGNLEVSLNFKIPKELNAMANFLAIAHRPVFYLKQCEGVVALLMPVKDLRVFCAKVK